MAGNQQRPTDDVEGHGRYWQDPEATDDRGVRVPDDTEGHFVRAKHDTEAVDDDRGSRIPDDTEGHTFRIKQDPEAVDEDQAGDDTEGHGRWWP